MMQVKAKKMLHGIISGRKQIINYTLRYVVQPTFIISGV
jgi:hypothetical protein